jgi:hypothetical protein
MVLGHPVTHLFYFLQQMKSNIWDTWTSEVRVSLGQLLKWSYHCTYLKNSKNYNNGIILTPFPTSDLIIFIWNLNIFK